MNIAKNITFADPRSVLFDIARSSSDIVIIADWQRTMLFANSMACEKTGYKQRELAEKKVAILYRKENRSRYTSKIFQHLREHDRWNGEIEIRKKDGSTFTADTTITVYRDKAGKPAGTISVGRDLTGERLLQQHTMEREDQLLRIIESMDDAVGVCDLEGKVLMCNAAHCAMLGYRKEEIVGARPPYPWVDAHDVDKTLIGFKRLRKEGVLRNFPVTWRRKDNTHLTVSFAVSTLFNSSRQPEGYICTIRDITDVQYVEDLRKTHEQNERLLKDIKYKAVRLSTLERTNTLVLQNAGPSKIFKEITAGVKKLVHHDLAGVYVHDTGRQWLIAHTLSKQTPFSRKLAKFPLPLGKGIIGAAAESGTMVWQNNAEQDPRSKYPPGMKPEKEHFIAVPLKGRKSIFGILVVARHRDPGFIEEEVLIVKSLAEAASVALENSRLFLELSVK